MSQQKLERTQQLNHLIMTVFIEKPLVLPCLLNTNAVLEEKKGDNSIYLLVFFYCQ